ncbi:MAG TPA: ribonuclease HI [Ruminococcaceae bacterium]|nr:ribonuclease HI [Oscillospiraceae bacterium]
MQSKRKHVDIFTDGACKGNPGPGGYGAILRFGSHEKELSGGAPSTTNNRMELSGVIAGLSCLKEPCDITLYSDSKYVVNGIEKGWAKKWRANGWRKSDKSPALNKELWENLLALLEIHDVQLIWVKGHAGHPENERCDALAVEAACRFQ